MIKEQNANILFSELPGNGGSIGEIRLNRAQAHNALTQDMCQALQEHLLAWENNPSIKAVIIRSTDDKTFCAGGDIRYLYECKQNKHKWIDFFRQEYSTNKLIYHYKKPYIALLDGLTMGGGVGVSLHGSHRVATENFIFAMPETGIGFFPDVVAGSFLNRCPHNMGTYLGLTGIRLQAQDALELKLITHNIAHKDIDQLVGALCKTTFTQDAKHDVSKIIDQYNRTLTGPSIMQHQSQIENCFKHDSIENIFDTLGTLATSWSNRVLKILLQRSPTSLKVTLEYLRRCKPLAFDAIAQVDFNLIHAFWHTPDFFEGVRAAIIDKDQTPKWQPPTILDITTTDVNAFFAKQERL